MLELKSLTVTYGTYLAVSDISLEVGEGEVVALLGLNGSGKSTVINAISGLVQHAAGSVAFLGNDLGSMPAYERVSLGISHVPERRRLFPFMTVYENLLLGAYLPDARRQIPESLASMLEMFPILRERSKQLAGTLSGGEQQQLAIARGLMSRPQFMLLDEPFLGLSPIMVAGISRAIAAIRQRGITVLFVEQNVRQAMSLSDRGYLLESGRLVAHGTESQLLADPVLRQTYFGVL